LLLVTNVKCLTWSSVLFVIQTSNTNLLVLRCLQLLLILMLSFLIGVFDVLSIICFAVCLAFLDMYLVVQYNHGKLLLLLLCYIKKVDGTFSFFALYCEFTVY